MKRALRGVTVAVLAGLALLLGAAPAMAHTRLLASDPPDGASLDSGPERVSLTFNEAVAPGFATLTVVGPDGGRYETGEVSADGGMVSIAVQPLGSAGHYEIGYRVVSADGHPVTGSVGFTLTAPGPATAAPAAPAQAASPATAPATASSGDTADDGGAPLWPWIVGAVVLVVGGVIAALRVGRG
ncbi:copper resistance CopC family protein [Pseudonocardia sp. MH-G8]|uniref:copper resistance CopC family protein n=1 Tax=Pseudonocardia sp. MH-G8 TaxID=1854588 RepID=UPI000B9FB219|nr:copper resistance CopC family protein [Pseudonocardia sp. MH-G8]OZM76559.1 copper resistance protein CopC [Pseudonocardia sp. MH-G8]